MAQPKVSFAAGLGEFSQVDDDVFLKGLAWDRGVNDAVRAAAASGSVRDFVGAWLKQFRSADTGRSTRFPAAMLWSATAFPDEQELEPLLSATAGVAPAAGLKRRSANKTAPTFAQRAEPLVQAITAHPIQATVPWALGIALELLTTAGSSLAPVQYWRLWRWTLCQCIIQGSHGPNADPTLPGDVLLVETGENRYLAGVLFSGIEGAGSVLRAGRSMLARELVDKTDTDGTPHAELLERLPLWLAPFIRVTSLSRRFEIKLWTWSQEELLRSVVERVIPLCQTGGRAVLGQGHGLDPLPLLVVAAECCQLPEAGSVGSYLRSVKRVAAGKTPARPNSDGVLTMPSNQSDFARFALLRSDWSVKADTVAVAHHRPIPQLDVTAAGLPIIHGDWGLKLQIGGTPVELADEWSCVCWQSDPDADYLELQMTGPGQLRVERIVMLSRTLHVLLIADSVSGVPRDLIQYESVLPLAGGIRAQESPATREIVLQSRGFRGRAFPLALPQDHVQGTPHRFEIIDGTLRLTQTANAQGLFAPILLDWDPDRGRTPVQWRTLTVTEDGRVVGIDTASGHRIRSGDLQLLVYRSLKAPDTARAVLGHHTWNETVVARVDKRGDVDPFLMVES